MDVRLFISHSSADMEFANRLVNLFRMALGMKPFEIRCTSVPGYKLPAGAKISDQVKSEVFGSTVFLALLTPASLDSSYVLFELGARWSTGLPLLPLFACGAKPSHVNAWLGDFNGMLADQEAGLLQLIEDAAKLLDLTPEPSSTYLSAIAELVAESKRLENEHVGEYGGFDAQTQRLKEVEMETEDQSLFDEFSHLWNIANEYFVRHFKPTLGLVGPDTLYEMLESAGSPPGVTTNGQELNTWPARYGRRLTEDQRRMWKFVTAIYPPRSSEMTGDVTLHSAIKPESSAVVFHKSRRALAGFYDKWTGVLGLKRVNDRSRASLDYVLFLAWLELALTQWTQHAGMGKKGLFVLSEYMAHQTAGQGVA